MPRLPTTRLAATALVVLLAGTASANPYSTFGAGSRAIGMGGGATAAATSTDACYYNPGALGFLDATEVITGLGIWRPFLAINGKASEANTTKFQLDAGIASNIPLGSGFLQRFLFMGVQLSIPGMTLYEVRARPVAQPHFPFLQERNRRLVLNLAWALRLHRMVSIGAGLSLLPDVIGSVGVDFTQEGTLNRTAVDVKAHMSANAGIRVEPLPGLTFGATWRGANRTWLSMPVAAKLSKQLAPIDIRVLAYDWSTPHELAVGAAWKRGAWAVAGDVTVSFYSQFHQSAPEVRLYDAAGGLSQTSSVPAAGFRNSVAVRAGAEWRAVEPLLLRAGFGWVQSPVPAQTGVTNLLDGDRFPVSIGAGFDMERIGGPPLVLNGHLQWSPMVGNRDEKLVLIPGNPGYPSIRGSGSVLAAGIELVSRFGGGAKP